MQWQCHIIWIDNKSILTPIITQQLGLNTDFQIHTCSPVQLNLDYLKEVKANLILTQADIMVKNMDLMSYPIISLGQAAFTDHNIQSIKLPLRLFDLTQTIRQTFIKSGIQLQDWTLNPKTLELINSNQSIQLTDKESAILNILYHAAPRQVNKNTLLQNIWNYHVEIETHTLETHIYKLRQKIEKDAKNPAIILTEDDGYRLDI